MSRDFTAGDAKYPSVHFGRSLLMAVADEAVRAGALRLFAELRVTARSFFERHLFAVSWPNRS